MISPGSLPHRKLRIALLASCTAQLLPDLLAQELRPAGFDPEFWIAGFDQVRQQLLDAGSDFYAHGAEIVLLYLDGEDLFRDCLADPLACGAEERQQLVAARVAELHHWLETAGARLPRAVFFLNTIGLPPLHAATGLEYNFTDPLQDLAYAYNRSLRQLASQNDAVAIVDAAAVMAWIGYREWHDARLWYLARSRWSRAAMRALAQHYGAAIRGWFGQARKCIVLDLDNTLWGGIVGEDGMAGLQLGEEGIGLAFVEFQQELLNLSRKGILLALSSKNNPEEALEVIRSHPSMRLREEHFASMRIGWEDKAAQLRSIAEELNLGLDSLVFIDDNPAERALVAGSIPEVLVPEWPADPVEARRALLTLAFQAFPKLRVTEEDRSRTALYRGQAARRSVQAQATSLEEFYWSLRMVARIGVADAGMAPRIAQLTQKTNQFNLTTRRYSEAEIRALLQAPDALVLWLELTDRFGPNGVVGVLILRQGAAAEWRIDTFLLSCRVIGRTAEQALLARACALLRARGAGRLIGEYRPTVRNGMVASLYAKLGFAPAAAPDGSSESTWWDLELSREVLRVPEWIEITAEERTHA